MNTKEHFHSGNFNTRGHVHAVVNTKDMFTLGNTRGYVHSVGNTRGHIPSEGNTRGHVHSVGNTIGYVHSEGNTRGHVHSEGTLEHMFTLTFSL